MVELHCGNLMSNKEIFRTRIEDLSDKPEQKMHLATHDFIVFLSHEVGINQMSMLADQGAQRVNWHVPCASAHISC